VPIVVATVTMVLPVVMATVIVVLVNVLGRHEGISSN
jgi:hypothetical protein